MKRTPSTSAAAAAAPANVRVGIYCRQSVASDMAFGSIQAQRESVEAFAKSQGWNSLPTDYSDGGYTGSNTARPGYQRLLADVAAGRIDIVGVYRIDRVSRSLADFSKFVELLDKHGVGFVSITQSFDTRTSMGRLTLNILASFSQFERETIAERTADKIRATRLKGLWTGGPVPCGYVTRDRQLVVDPDAAENVRLAYRTYLDTGSLVDTVSELDRRAIRNRSLHGAPTAFNKNTLRSMLSNPVYRGLVRAGDELVAGKHEAIVDKRLWDEVQHMLRDHRKVTRAVPGRWGAILTGILRCAKCDQPMSHTASKRGPRTHRYYVCQSIMKKGAGACPGSRAPAVELEEVVLGQVRSIGGDPALLLAMVSAAHRQRATQRPELVAEMRRLTNDRTVFASQRTNLLDALQNGDTATASIAGRITELDEQIGRLQTRLDEVATQLAGIESNTLDEAGIRDALTRFGPVWDALEPRERQRVLHILIEVVKFDAQAGEVEIVFRDTGIQALQREVAARRPA